MADRQKAAKGSAVQSGGMMKAEARWQGNGIGGRTGRNQMTEEKKVRIILNDRSYEYDVYTLVIAFFQGIPVSVCTPEAQNDQVSGDVPGTRHDGLEKGRTGEIISQEQLTIEVTISDRSITVEARRADQLLVRQTAKAGEKLQTGQLPENLAWTQLPESQKRLLVKNALKRCLYECLSSLTGRTLPWGDLTGIRPVKLASAFLENDQDEASAEADLQAEYLVSARKAGLAVSIASREQRILRKIHPEKGYSLYIGIPFCPSICLYCSFSSGTIGVWQKEADHYVDALIHEMAACGRHAERPCFPGRELQTVYIGGGTPTTLTAQQLERVCNALEEHFDMDRVLEFTVEAGRPDTITEEKLAVLRKHRVSRISINPQTMNQKTLDLIGRKHTVEQTEEAFRLARSMGFDNINMDLIVGLPGEGPEEVDRTMCALERLDPDDITVHALALKRAARLALHMDEYESISFQASDEIMERTHQTCQRLGMTPYYLYRQKNMAGNFENVGYAKSGHAGIYNILIMEEVQSILALGASGSTKVIYPGGRIERIENVKDVRSYLDRIDEMIQRKKVLR
jgi:coproporphyrinogen dehydrogenase HemZ